MLLGKWYVLKTHVETVLHPSALYVLLNLDFHNNRHFTQTFPSMVFLRGTKAGNCPSFLSPWRRVCFQVPRAHHQFFTVRAWRGPLSLGLGDSSLSQATVHPVVVVLLHNTATLQETHVRSTCHPHPH